MKGLTTSDDREQTDEEKEDLTSAVENTVIEQAKRAAIDADDGAGDGITPILFAILIISVPRKECFAEEGNEY